LATDARALRVVRGRAPGGALSRPDARRAGRRGPGSFRDRPARPHLVARAAAALAAPERRRTPTGAVRLAALTAAGAAAGESARSTCTWWAGRSRRSPPPRAAGRYARDRCPPRR